MDLAGDRHHPYYQGLYEKAGMATGGGQQLHVTQLGFRPAPPEGARTLTLTLVDGDEPNAPMAVVEIELATEA